MMNERDPRLERRRPSDLELDTEATVTEEDVREAIASFNRYAPPEAKGLLNAKEMKGDG